MRRPQPSPEHSEAVSRRLTTLSAELAAVRGEQFTHTRIRGLAPAPPVPAEAPEPVIVPTPGRHASRRGSRRPLSGWSQRVGSGGTGQGRIGLGAIGPAHVAVVATLAALAVGVAAWLVVRNQAEPVTMPTITTSSQSPADLAPVSLVETTAEPGGGGDVTVDVAGKVRSPGIAVLPSGARVVDALAEAGGARRGVDLTSLNLARLLVDGEQILVGVSAPEGVAASVGEPGSPPTTGTLVNLNTSDQVTLESLPGVGPVTATAILEWRAEHGAFTSVDELLEVSGIGDATLADLAPLVTI